jgi:hypothetical protein
MVEALNAYGDWLPKRACSTVERGHTFPVVFVARPEEWDAAQREGREPESVAWPAADVRSLS